MARSLTAGMQTQVQAAVLSPVELFKVSFDSGNLLLWTGTGPLVWAGDTYTGGGGILTVSRIEETQDLRATGVEFVLSGVDVAMSELVEAEDYQGRTVQVWFAALDSAGAVIADPYEIYRGFADVMTDSNDGATATVGLKTENMLISLQRPKEGRYTNEDQQIDNPGDLFFEFVALLQEKEIVGK